MIVSTQGATAGAVLIKFNLASSSSTPSGIWDMHARVGCGQLQLHCCFHDNACLPRTPMDYISRTFGLGPQTMI